MKQILSPSNRYLTQEKIEVEVKGNAVAFPKLQISCVNAYQTDQACTILLLPESAD